MKRFLGITLFGLLLVMSAQAQEKPKLERGKDFVEAPAIGEGLCVNNLFQSGMVIQRDKPILVWGWATAGEAVSVSFGDKAAKATAAQDRTWQVSLPAQPANSEPQSLVVKGKDKTLTLEDILIGDVWVLGGQSNMEFPLYKIVDGDLEIASANFPKIRHLTVPQQDGAELKQAFPRQYKWSSWSNRHFKQGYWETCNPTTVRELSGLGYAFVRRIHMATQIPIGVIDVSRGGTTVETWAPLEELRKIEAPETKAWLAEWDKKVAEFDPQADLENRIKRHHDWLKRMEQSKREVSADRKKDPTDLRKGPIMDQNKPGNCYASMIAPLIGIQVKGAIFHQGFNNCFQGTKGAKMYYQVFGPMITAWRKAFGNPAMPFGIISLCTAGHPQDLNNYVLNTLDIGVELREAQYKTFVDFQKAGDKNIGFASSFDQRRSWYHPQIKIPVGERMARWALATQYGHKLPWAPPAIQEMKAEGGTIILTLDTNTGPHNDGPILGFAIAGEDKKFQPAKAEYFVKGRDSRNRIQHDRRRIVLSSPMIANPVHFRHAWSRNPLTNLKANSIPLATQRSDTWSLEELYEAYSGEKVKDPVAGLDRGEKGLLKKALKAADLERRLFEAKALINQQTEEKK